MPKEPTLELNEYDQLIEDIEAQKGAEQERLQNMGISAQDKAAFTQLAQDKPSIAEYAAPLGSGILALSVLIFLVIRIKRAPRHWKNAWLLSALWSVAASAFIYVDRTDLQEGHLLVLILGVPFAGLVFYRIYLNINADC